jgi:hypothetical protein
MKGKKKEKEKQKINTSNNNNNEKIYEEDFIYNKKNINNLYQRIKEKEKPNLKNTKNKVDNKIPDIRNNEQFKHTIKLAFSGILVFLVFYLLKIGLGYYLRNKLNLDI